MTVETFIAFITGPFGALILLIFIIATGMKGAWVFGFVYRDRIKDLKDERDEWKAIAKPAIDAANELARVASGRRAQD